MKLHKVVRGVELKEIPEDIGDPKLGWAEEVAHNSLANAEVVVDREKMANIILFELQAGKWQLVNTLVNSGDVVDIAQAIATAIESGSIISLTKPLDKRN